MPTMHADPASDPSISPSCEEGRHLPSSAVVTDASGVAQTRCRRCGCTLRRLPIGRWYRSGWIG